MSLTQSAPLLLHMVQTRAEMLIRRALKFIFLDFHLQRFGVFFEDFHLQGSLKNLNLCFGKEKKFLKQLPFKHM